MLSLIKHALSSNINKCGSTNMIVRDLKSWTGGKKFVGFTYYPR